MATPVITSDTDPIIQQVRDCSLLLREAGLISNAEIRRYLNENAFPRVHGMLMTARVENSTGNGQLLFYTMLPELADASVAAAAQQLVYDVMLRPMVKDWCYSIAAQFAAGHILRALFAQIPEQAKAAVEFEEKGLSDIKLLIKAPTLTQAIADTLAEQQAVKAQLPRIYVVLDVDPSTVGTGNTIRTYNGAQEVGTATVWVGVNSVSTPVNPGDKPPQILQRLASAMRALYATNINVPNVVLGPNEGPRQLVSRTIREYDFNNAELATTYSTQVNLSYLEFNAHRYDDTVDAWFATLELVNQDGALGINGLLYGVTNVYEQLTNLGPYSQLLDLSPSKTGTTAVTNEQDNLLTQDTFWFVVDTPPTEDSFLHYQVGNLVSYPSRDPVADPLPRAVVIPAGATAMDMVLALAKDMQEQARVSGLLPGVRSPVQIEVMGSPMLAPGMRVVPWRASRLETKLVFDLLSVPSGTRFGVLPPTLVTNTAFDEGAKSLVLTPIFVPGAFTASGAGEETAVLDIGFQAKAVAPIHSSRLQSLNNDLKFLRRPY